MSTLNLPITVPPKARLASAVVMSISPSKSENNCPKENCPIHVPKVDTLELNGLMGCLSLSDISNNKDRLAADTVVEIPQALSDLFIRKPKVRFHFVRHAQAIHNIHTIVDATSLRDTNLTPHGMEQSRTLSASFPHTSKIKYVLCSPLRRSINTALIGFPSVYARGVQCILYEDLREFGQAQCNTGSTLLKLRENFKEINTGVVNTDLIYGGWEWLHEYGRNAKRDRIVKVKKALKEFESVAVNGGTWKGMVFMPHHGEDNVEVVVVSHGGLLCQLMGYPKQNWANAEWRTFKFPSASKIADGHLPLNLIQTKASLGKVHTPIPEPGPRFHMVIDDTTYERLAEIQEFNEHVEMMKRKAREGEARAFGEYMKNAGAEES
ncbi:histidine phosphatase superfamily [Cadophora sp. MPI-SDFR-AT-0126]|nr:histidine phosphatase superfamily [Leotiomycetes sp. MPI-SDFR-AT-0126]